MYNKLTIIGNLGSDPEPKQSKTGNPYVTFSVATQNYGEENTEWFRVLVFGKIAESCEKFLKKGDKVYVEGPFRSSSWEDDDGNKRTSFSLLCNTIKFLTGRNKEDDKKKEDQSEIPF